MKNFLMNTLREVLDTLDNIDPGELADVLEPYRNIPDHHREHVQKQMFEAKLAWLQANMVRR